MKRYGYLFEQITSFDNLLLAGKKAIRAKRNRPDAQRFHFNLEKEILEIQDALKNQMYRPGPYHTFNIRDPKARTISVAPMRDRVVHHANSYLARKRFFMSSLPLG